MTDNVTKADLIEYVRRLRKDEGSAEELAQMMRTLQEMLPHPNVERLIFGGDPFAAAGEHELTAEQVVDKGLTYQSFDPADQ